MTREVHTSKVRGQVGVGKIVANLQRYVYWPKMQEHVASFIRGCMLCCTWKPSKIKQSLYNPLLVPTHPWENISMDFVGGLLTTKKGHDYLFMVVDRFNKMCVLMPCTKPIIRKEATNLFFGQVWVHFGIPRSIISYRDTRFLSAFWTTLWEKMDTKLKISTIFDPQTYGQTKVVNRTLVWLLRGYNKKHLKVWDENLMYIQHSYNKSVQTSTGKSRFETCFGYFPPSPLHIAYGKKGWLREDITRDSLRDEKIIEKIRKIHL